MPNKGSAAEILVHDNNYEFVVVRDPLDSLNGDVDNNTTVNLLDFIKLKFYILVSDNYSDLPGADLNSDGTVNVLDVMDLIKILLNTGI